MTLAFLLRNSNTESKLAIFIIDAAKRHTIDKIKTCGNKLLLGAKRGDRVTNRSHDYASLITGRNFIYKHVTDCVRQPNMVLTNDISGTGILEEIPILILLDSLLDVLDEFNLRDNIGCENPAVL
jgi:hypothetical protein